MRKRKGETAPDVAAIATEISRFFQTEDDQGRRIGVAKGVYAFFDYDGEPIYVGQSDESLGGRVGRHLTNQRTDAVAMNVLDPHEVAEIEVWPLYYDRDGDKALLDRLEYTIFQKVLGESSFGAILNEKDVPEAESIELPKAYRARIVPDEIFDRRKHPDLRIARRANTIARLAQVISERDVSPGLRRTLVTQARRLERLAEERFQVFRADVPKGKAVEE